MRFDGTGTGTDDTGLSFDGTGNGTEGTDSSSTDAYDTEGEQQQLPFFKYFQNGQKFMKELRPIDKNIREMWTFSYLRLLAPPGQLENGNALISVSRKFVCVWKTHQHTI